LRNLVDIQGLFRQFQARVTAALISGRL
jgi:hypothetical protein